MGSPHPQNKQSTCNDLPKVEQNLQKEEISTCAYVKKSGLDVNVSPSFSDVLKRTQPDKVEKNSSPNNSGAKVHTSPKRKNDKVKKKRERVIITGNSDNDHDKLKASTPGPKKKAIFVSRLNPDTSSTDILSHIKERVGCDAKCVKLKTKFDTYASFWIQVQEVDFPTIFTAKMWPSGILLSEFMGHLKPHQILRSDSVQLLNHKPLTKPQEEETTKDQVVFLDQATK